MKSFFGGGGKKSSRSDKGNPDKDPAAASGLHGKIGIGAISSQAFSVGQWLGGGGKSKRVTTTTTAGAGETMDMTVDQIAFETRQESALDPRYSSILDEYWDGYTGEKGLASDATRMPGRGGAASVHRRSARQRQNPTASPSSDRQSRHATKAEEGSQRDGLRFLELVSKLNCTGHAIGSDVHERILLLVENHRAHRHVCGLSQEGALVLEQLSERLPPCRITEGAQADANGRPAHPTLAVNPHAWTPLAFQRRSEGDETNLRQSRRNVCTPWTVLTTRVEQLASLVARLCDEEVPPSQAEREDPTSGPLTLSDAVGHVLALRHYVSVIETDIVCRVRVSNARGRGGMGAGAVAHPPMPLRMLVEGSVLYKLICLPHETIDSINMSQKTFFTTCIEAVLGAALVLQEMGTGKASASAASEEGEGKEGEKGEGKEGEGKEGDGGSEAASDAEVLDEIRRLFARLVNLLFLMHASIGEHASRQDDVARASFTNGSKRLDAWFCELFFKHKVGQSMQQGNAMLQIITDPHTKLRLIGNIFARYLEKHAHKLPDALVTLRTAVELSGTINQSCHVDEDEILTLVEMHPNKSILAMEGVDRVALMLVHIAHAKLALLYRHGDGGGLGGDAGHAGDAGGGRGGIKGRGEDARARYVRAADALRKTGYKLSDYVMCLMALARAALDQSATWHANAQA